MHFIFSIYLIDIRSNALTMFGTQHVSRLAYTGSMNTAVRINIALDFSRFDTFTKVLVVRGHTEDEIERNRSHEGRG